MDWDLIIIGNGLMSYLIAIESAMRARRTLLINEIPTIKNNYQKEWFTWAETFQIYPILKGARLNGINKMFFTNQDSVLSPIPQKFEGPFAWILDSEKTLKILRQEVKKLGVEFVEEKIKSLKKINSGMQLITEKNKYDSRFVAICSNSTSIMEKEKKLKYFSKLGCIFKTLEHIKGFPVKSSIYDVNTLAFELPSPNEKNEDFFLKIYFPLFESRIILVPKWINELPIQESVILNSLNSFWRRLWKIDRRLETIKNIKMNIVQKISPLEFFCLEKGHLFILGESLGLIGHNILGEFIYASVNIAKKIGEYIDEIIRDNQILNVEDFLFNWKDPNNEIFNVKLNRDWHQILYHLLKYCTKNIINSILQIFMKLKKVELMRFFKGKQNKKIIKKLIKNIKKVLEERKFSNKNEIVIPLMNQFEQKYLKS